jgi:hypothetical protein
MNRWKNNILLIKTVLKPDIDKRYLLIGIEEVRAPIEKAVQKESCKSITSFITS